jgi:nucleoside-diphosphate-sugar epimerase
MNYFITGGTGFIGTHLASLLHEVHPETRIYNLDIVEPGTPLPTVKNYKPALRKGEEHAATFIYCDVRQPIELEKVNITPDDVIFNFAAVHRTPGHPDPAYFETNIRGAENVCAFAERHGIRKIVFTSSKPLTVLPRN